VANIVFPVKDTFGALPSFEFMAGAVIFLLKYKYLYSA
jgi:hypothetical protein